MVISMHRFVLLGLTLGIAIFSWTTFTDAVRSENLWIHATEVQRLSGPVAFGRSLGIEDSNAIGDFLLPTLLTQENKPYEGSAQYSVIIPKAGKYYVWARLKYPSGLDESFQIVPEGAKPSCDVRQAIGKGKMGMRQWHWAGQSGCNGGNVDGSSQGIELPAGEWSFAIYPRESREQATFSADYRMTRPMFCPRLNAICLTTDVNYVPNDADARKHFSNSVKLNNPLLQDSIEPICCRCPDLPQVSDEELRLSGKQRIPDWLRCPRFYTKDSHRHEMRYRREGDIGEMVRQISANGASAFRLSVCWGGETYYQSKVAPHVPGLGKIDFLREALEESEQLGIKVVAYINPNALWLEHPLCKEAAIRSTDGKIVEVESYGKIEGTRYACINNPKYRKFLKEIISEIFTEYKPAGLYVDGLSPHRCFCEHCRAKYKQMWGQRMPVEKFAGNGRHWGVLWEMTMQPMPIGRPDDSDDKRYTKFLYQSCGEVKRLIAKTVRGCKPDAAVIIHNWPKPNSLDCYDATLTEVYINYPWQHTLWKTGEVGKLFKQLCGSGAV